MNGDKLHTFLALKLKKSQNKSKMSKKTKILRKIFIE